MTRRSRLLSAVAPLLLGTAFLTVHPEPLYALWGMGDVVFDPSSWSALGHIWEEDISTGAKLAQTYNQTVKIVKNGLQLWSIANAMAQRIQNKDVWKMAAFAVGDEQSQQHYNETINWSAVMNGDVLDAGQAWRQSTRDGGAAGYLANATAPNSSRMAEYATLQMLDATSQRCASILANYKQTQDQNQNAENRLNTDTFDKTDAKNSMVAVLNVLSGGRVHLQTQERANGNLEACLAEQKTLEAKLQRDRLADEQNWYSDIAQERATAPALLDPDQTAFDIGGGYLVP